MPFTGNSVITNSFHDFSGPVRDLISSLNAFVKPHTKYFVQLLKGTTISDDRLDFFVVKKRSGTI